jgi:hypothetical protein
MLGEAEVQLFDLGLAIYLYFHFIPVRGRLTNPGLSGQVVLFNAILFNGSRYV